MLHVLAALWNDVSEGAAQQLSVTLFAAGAAGLTTNALYACAYEKYRRRKMYKAFRTDWAASPLEAGMGWMEHEPAERLVFSLVNGRCSYVLTGECGSGKSRLLRRAVEATDAPAVYVNCRHTQSGSITSQIAEQVNFNFDERVAWVNKIAEQLLGYDPSEGRADDDEDADWRRMVAAVESTASAVFESTGKQPLLVIDNIHRLADDSDAEARDTLSPAILKVSEWAAACTDDHTHLRVIVALPYGKDLRMLLKRRCLSRLQLCSIPKLNPEVARTWLVKQLDVSTEHADQFVHRVGSLPLALQRAVEQYRTLGVTLEQFEDELFDLGMQMLQRWELTSLRNCEEEGPARAQVWRLMLELIDAEDENPLHSRGRKSGVIAACGLCNITRLSPQATEVVDKLFDASILSSQNGLLYVHAPPVRVAVIRFTGAAGTDKRRYFEGILSRIDGS